jgi:hypothetical protein
MANPQVKYFKQSDGTVFKGKMKGDEAFHYIQTNDGNIVKYNKKSKNYEYMILKNNDLVFSNIKAKSFSKQKAKSQKATKQLFTSNLKIQKIKSDDLFKIWKEKRKKFHR